MRSPRCLAPDPAALTSARSTEVEAEVAKALVDRGVALRWDTVELEGRRPSPRVEGSLQRTPAGLAVLPPKTERSRRSVSLPQALVASLRRHREEQDERRSLAGEAWADGGYVFDRGDGQSVDPDASGRAFRVARDAARLAGVRLHDLRHAYATMQIAEGQDPRLVADLLGHATVAFTLQKCVHPSEEAAAAAADTAERLLGAAVEGSRVVSGAG